MNEHINNTQTHSKRKYVYLLGDTRGINKVGIQTIAELGDSRGNLVKVDLFKRKRIKEWREKEIRQPAINTGKWMHK